MLEVTVDEVSQAARRIYCRGNRARRLMIRGRSYICPFEELISKIPQGSSVLDVGCGDGLFLNLLGFFGNISEGTGFDTNGTAIANAQLAKENSPYNNRLQFLERSIGQPLPNRLFDVVSMIDVLHHIPVEDKESAIIGAAAHVKPGGILLFKDIGQQPRWRAFANTLHDFVLTGDRVSYTPLDLVVAWARAAGMREEERKIINRLWYGHEMIVFRK
jgi:2-polyprenyl-3-methyl-5-hydroxy-6-metoxy-1,4-benzoquinol methylase